MTKTSNKKTETSIRIGSEVNPAPKVSVIIPAYNISEFIAETLDSAFIQTFINFEVIVINDGSPDTEAFENVLAPYLEKIVYLKQPNIGAGPARNFGIETARGELIAFLDGDDIWYPEFLESQVKFLEENGYDLVYPDALLFGGSAFDGKNYMLDAPSEGEANFESLLDMRCNVITSGVVTRKKNVMEAGMFETEKVRAHDFVLWLRMVKNGAKVGYQRRILLKYRVRLDSLSGNSIQRVQREIDVFERIKRLILLTDFEQEIVANQLTRLNAEIEIEKGKSLLLQENFAAAREAFEKGNQYRQSNKLRLIILFLRFTPKLLLKYYKSQRADEIAFIPQ
ncbi:MAG TPA: glycosyltransferase family 2 protein [Pyrinomonadaceae bacterium]|nr:glycosyltransferase family 2 protein [Pyrinomonadaceae bacterium]